MKFYSALFFVFFTGILQAQFPQDVSYQTIADPIPVLPPFLGSIVDNTLPDAIEITRISEYNSEWNWYPHHEYSKIQPWNADASLYKFYSNGIYDAQTHQLLYEIQNAGSIYPTYWANTNPDLLYGFMENGDIKTYSVSQQQVTTLDHIYYDEANQIDYEYFKMGPGEGNFDMNDKYVAFVGKHNADMDVIIYDLEQYQILHRETFTDAWGNGPAYAPDYVDWVSVSLSGDYVVIMWNHNTCSASNPFNGHFGVEVYDRNMQFLRRIADYGNHGDFAFAQDGDEVFVQFWGPTGSMNMYYLDRMQRVVLIDHPDFDQHAAHISGRNIHRQGWAYANIADPDIGMIVAVKLDDSGLVEYFGHTYSSCDSYLNSPMPVPSPNGDKVMFKSDFGDGNPDVVYTFEAQLYTSNSVAENPLEIIEIFPNPAGDFIEISAPFEMEKIRLINPAGQIIKEITDLHTKNLRLNVNNIHPGLYLMQIVGENDIITKKILVRN